MLNFLFRGLTARPATGEPLFDAITAKAREPHWYVAGEVPDTLDGRFAMVATITALTIVRLERLGEAGNLLSVALTERFIEVMESEHRELGLGDPALGKTVRRLVGSLDRRTDLWRNALASKSERSDAVRRSLYKDEPSKPALQHSSDALDALWSNLQSADADQLAEGKME